MSHGAFGLGFTIFNVFAGISSFLVAAAIVRWGVRKTFGIGSALILLGALWLTLITSRPWHYWVGFGVLTATGISFGTIIPAATAVTRWFSRYRGRAMAVTLSASGFAGFFASPLINRILTANGGNWRQAWALVAVISVLSAIVAFLFVIAAVFCSSAGFLGGKVFDTYHSYKLAFEFNSLVAAAAIFALFFARYRYHREMNTIAD